MNTGYVQNDRAETVLQANYTGVDAAAARQLQLRSDPRLQQAVTVYNYVEAHNASHRKKYKFINAEERILYNLGCQWTAAQQL
jgi:hypothetical protein